MTKNLVGTLNFFSWILPLLNVRHCCKLSLYAILRKPNETNLRKGKKPSSRTNFGSKIFFYEFFYLHYMLDIIASYHWMQFQWKLTNQTWENSNKPSVGIDFDPFGPKFHPKNFIINFNLLHVRYCCELSLHALSRKINGLNLRKLIKI